MINRFSFFLSRKTLKILCCVGWEEEGREAFIKHLFCAKHFTNVSLGRERGRYTFTNVGLSLNLGPLGLWLGLNLMVAGEARGTKDTYGHGHRIRSSSGTKAETAEGTDKMLTQASKPHPVADFLEPTSGVPLAELPEGGDKRKKRLCQG